MKKISGVIALLLSIIIFLILRQLTGSHTKTVRPKVSVTAIVQEYPLLSSLLMQ